MTLAHGLVDPKIQGNPFDSPFGARVLEGNQVKILQLGHDG